MGNLLYLFAIIVMIASMVLLFWALNKRKKYVQSASYPPAKVPVLPGRKYTFINELVVFFLISGVLFYAIALLDFLEDGCILSDEIDSVVILFILFVLVPLAFVILSKLSTDKTTVYHLCVEDGLIKCLNQFGDVLCTYSAENVKAIRICDVTVIEYYHTKHGQRYSALHTDRYIALLTDADNTYVPPKIDSDFRSNLVSKKFILIIYSPKSLEVLKKVFDVPIMIDPSKE